MTPALFALGDSAITIDYGNIINEDINDIVLARFSDLQRHPFPGMIEAIPAYASLTILYDVFALRGQVTEGSTVYDLMHDRILEWLRREVTVKLEKYRTIRIPVFYDGPDLQTVADLAGLTPNEVIKIHTEGKYRVYMLGFLPGFAYMGRLDKKLQLPRKDQPSVMQQGSVAIAGNQTGIYPLNSPGGWWVIGRTDLQLFDGDRYEPCLLRPGDRIEFYSSSTCAL